MLDPERVIPIPYSVPLLSERMEVSASYPVSPTKVDQDSTTVLSNTAKKPSPPPEFAEWNAVVRYTNVTEVVHIALDMPRFTDPMRDRLSAPK